MRLCNEYYWTFCSEYMNSPWLQPGVMGAPYGFGFSPSVKIKAWAKARSRGATTTHALKHVAINGLRAQCLVVL